MLPVHTKAARPHNRLSRGAAQHAALTCSIPAAGSSSTAASCTCRGGSSWASPGCRPSQAAHQRPAGWVGGKGLGTGCAGGLRGWQADPYRAGCAMLIGRVYEPHVSQGATKPDRPHCASTHLLVSLAAAVGLAEAPLLLHVVRKDAAVAVAAGLGVAAQLVRLLRAGGTHGAGGTGEDARQTSWGRAERRLTVARPSTGNSAWAKLQSAGAAHCRSPAAFFPNIMLCRAALRLPIEQWQAVFEPQLAAAAAGGKTMGHNRRRCQGRRRGRAGLNHPPTASPLGRLPVPASAGSAPCPSW